MDKLQFRDDQERVLYEKLLAGIPLHEEELENLLSFSIDTKVLYVDKHVIDRRDVVSIGGKYFAMEWSEGHSDWSRNEYNNQPYEVVPKLVTITEYVEIESVKIDSLKSENQ